MTNETFQTVWRIWLSGGWVMIPLFGLAVVLYVAQIVTGRKILAGDRSRLPGHKKLAVFFLAARLAAYVTMFMLP